MSDITQLVVLKGQLETEGILDPAKQIDVTKYASQIGADSGCALTVVYALDDIVKWGKSDVEYTDRFYEHVGICKLFSDIVFIRRISSWMNMGSYVLTTFII